MIRCLLLTLSAWLLFFYGTAQVEQQDPAYRLFEAKGEPASYQAMLGRLSKADVILFGEYHDDPIGHWLQKKVAGDLYKEIGDGLILGMEMFAADEQLLLDELLAGTIRHKDFEQKARIWSSYETALKPLVSFAREKELPLIGTNIPRRYAALVHRRGLGALDSLSGEARQYMTPLPIEVDTSLESYRKMLSMGHGDGMNLVRAQAVKDATMAHFILQHWMPGMTFFHLNGSFHSDNREGIVAYLRKAAPELDIVTIATVRQEKIERLNKEYEERGDFILCVPENMTRTH